MVLPTKTNWGHTMTKIDMKLPSKAVKLKKLVNKFVENKELMPKTKIKSIWNTLSYITLQCNGFISRRLRMMGITLFVKLI